MSTRYAIYYAPTRDTALHNVASAWLGRDAFTGAPLERPSVLDDPESHALTADPRSYGFHATLRAPFELAESATEQSLLDFAKRFAHERAAFRADIAVNDLGRFIAFTLAMPSPQMQALHEDCVRAFEPYRAPLSPGDIARRRKATLTPEQDAYMLAYGYPYLFEHFRFHMTLTGAIRDDDARAAHLATLRQAFAAHEGAHLFSAISVFKQPARGEDFLILAQFPFAV